MARRRETPRQVQSKLTRFVQAEQARVLAHFPRHRQPWTAREDKLLLKLFAGVDSRGTDSASYAIAERVGRTPMAVRKRVEILRLAEKYGGSP